MKKLKNKEKKRNNGITLIALVITMIVLLILAGVTIATLTGDNGILTKASQASDKTQIEEEKEAIKIAYNGVMVDNEGKGASATELQEELKMNGYNTTVIDNGDETLTVTFESKREYTINSDGSITIEENLGTVVEGVRIPEGFYHVEGSTVTGGLVISDVEGDDLNNTKGGNQYVWIPVDGILGEDGTIEDVKGTNGEKKILLGRYDFDSSGIPTEYSGFFKEETPEEHVESRYANTIAKDIEGFIESVRKNEGYYIARFEASRESSGKAESKYNKSAWTMINQPNAATACQDLYEEINSDLMNSYAWDTAILFIQKYGESNYSRRDGKLISSSKRTTGLSGDIQLNIYDIAGNCIEWVTESTCSTYYPYTTRGGCYAFSGGNPRYRHDNKTIDTSTGSYISFRPILYL